MKIDHPTHKVSQRNESRSKLGDEGLHQLNKSRRKSYDRETKLETIKYFNRCSNKYKTAKQFGIMPATLRGWLKNEDLIKKSSKRTQKITDSYDTFIELFLLTCKSVYVGKLIITCVSRAES